jgi:phosphopantothenoylcysteine decarboxylase / phosphopantothenate---cysteine ligase
MNVLVTAGPTREYLDDVRYLSNASSGKMGYALAAAARDAGWNVVLVSGPVAILPPAGCEFEPVVTTAQMREACLRRLPHCQGVIAAAAVCDFRPVHKIAGKISKQAGQVLRLELEQTEDILAELGTAKADRWIVGFALESQNGRENALRKLRDKNCDVILLNDPSAIGGEDTRIELLDAEGRVQEDWTGSKREVAALIVAWLREHLSTNE